MVEAWSPVVISLGKHDTFTQYWISAGTNIKPTLGERLAFARNNQQIPTYERLPNIQPPR